MGCGASTLCKSKLNSSVINPGEEKINHNDNKNKSNDENDMKKIEDYKSKHPERLAKFESIAAGRKSISKVEIWTVINSIMNVPLCAVELLYDQVALNREGDVDILEFINISSALLDDSLSAYPNVTLSQIKLIESDRSSHVSKVVITEALKKSEKKPSSELSLDKETPGIKTSTNPNSEINNEDLTALNDERTSFLTVEELKKESSELAVTEPNDKALTEVKNDTESHKEDCYKDYEITENVEVDTTYDLEPQNTKKKSVDETDLKKDEECHDKTIEEDNCEINLEHTTEVEEIVEVPQLGEDGVITETPENTELVENLENAEYAENAGITAVSGIAEISEIAELAEISEVAEETNSVEIKDPSHHDHIIEDTSIEVEKETSLKVNFAEEENGGIETV